MAKLIYFMPTSLDGYIEDESGKFDWATPDEEGFAFINDLERPIGTYLYGRKMYETMAIWETPDVIPPDVIPGGTPARLDFARTWQAADKIVYSKSLETVSTPKTRLEREFDPEAVRELKAQLPHDVSVGGPTLAARAIRTGLRRRDSAARRAYHDWVRQAGPAQQRTRRAGSPGRTPFCQWNGLSSVSHANLTAEADVTPTSLPPSSHNRTHHAPCHMGTHFFRRLEQTAPQRTINGSDAALVLTGSTASANL